MEVVMTCSACGKDVSIQDDGWLCPACYGRDSSDVEKLRFLMSRMQKEKDTMEEQINNLLTDVTYYKEEIQKLNEKSLKLQKQDDPNEGLTVEIAETLDTLSEQQDTIKELSDKVKILEEIKNEYLTHVLLQNRHIVNLKAENAELCGFINPNYGKPVVFELAEDEMYEKNNKLIVEVSKLVADKGLEDGDRISINLNEKKIAIVKKDNKIKANPEDMQEAIEVEALENDIKKRKENDKKEKTEDSKKLIQKRSLKKKKVPRLA